MAKAKNESNVMDGIFGTEGYIEEATKRKMNDKSLANLRTKEKSIEPTEKKYMQINVADYEDYIYRLAKANDMNMSEYVLHLLEGDKEKNIDLYEQLKKLPTFDKPERKPRNKKKN